MNRLLRAFRPPLREHILFALYRWIAWGLAGIMLLVPGLLDAPRPVILWLLVLTGVLNVVATGLAQAYVRIAQQRPWLMVLDVLVGVSLIWIGGGEMLPFLPYALGALVLPALLLRWPGSLSLAILFGVLDQLVLIILAPDGPMAANVARVLLPTGFVLAALALLAATRRLRAFSLARSAIWQDSAPRPGPHQSNAQRAPTLERRTPFDRQERARSTEASTVGSSVAAVETRNLPASLRLPANNRRFRQVRRTVYSKVGHHQAAELETTLRQLISDFGRDSDVVFSLRTLGAARPVSAARQDTLLRLAQEALLNIEQHAHAHSALILLSYEAHTVALTVQDDGVGLLDGTHERPGIHALRAIRYRLAEMDGQLNVFEGESGGVTVRGILPLGTT